MIEAINFVTIGQTPRTDLVPEIVSALPRPVGVVELGALDGLDADRIAALEPAADDHALVTRLRGGGQAVLGKRWLLGRLEELLGSMAPTPHEATVLLCTGDFSSLRGPGLFLDAQHLVDHGVAALSAGAPSLGLLVPLERQEGEHHFAPEHGQRLVTAHASPYQEDEFEAAGRSLGGCEVIVMHCMGYTEAQREAVARASGRPVLLARRLVAAAVGQLL